MAVLAPSWRTSSAAWLPQRCAQRRPASGRQRGKQTTTVGRAFWRWPRSGPWHGFSWKCHSGYGGRVRWHGTARGRRAGGGAQHLPRAGQPPARPLMKRPLTAAQRWGPGTCWTYHRAGGKGRREKKQKTWLQFQPKLWKHAGNAQEGRCEALIVVATDLAVAAVRKALRFPYGTIFTDRKGLRQSVENPSHVESC